MIRKPTSTPRTSPNFSPFFLLFLGETIWEERAEKRGAMGDKGREGPEAVTKQVDVVARMGMAGQEARGQGLRSQASSSVPTIPRQKRDSR